MDGNLARVMAEQRGFFYRWQALDCGYSPGEIAQRLTAKEWRPVRRGAYTTRQLVGGLDSAGRHLLAVRAAVGNLEGVVVVTGVSALAALSVPSWGVRLDEVHVYRDGCRTARTDAGVVHHRGPLPAAQIIEVEGLLVAVPERSVLDAARRVTFEAGVVLADGAKRLLDFDDDVAAALLHQQRDWAGAIRASRVLRFSDGAAESVGESRSRVLLARIGLPAPQLQKCFYNADGSLLARSDFYIEEYATVGEFDGQQKYGRAFYERTGRLQAVDLGEVVWSEKRREDGLRDRGNEVVRWVWFELDGHDQHLRARFEAAFRRSTRRSSRRSTAS
ncbi:MAG: hypothetical protein ACXV2H_05790 [Actinomycetes bacterium]